LPSAGQPKSLVTLTRQKPAIAPASLVDEKAKRAGIPKTPATLVGPAAARIARLPIDLKVVQLNRFRHRIVLGGAMTGTKQLNKKLSEAPSIKAFATEFI
jgi:hypothetical protein